MTTDKALEAASSAKLLRHTMSSDVKIPEWAMEEAVAFEKDLPSKITGTNRVFIRAVLARALLAAEQRGHKDGMEEAAKIAASGVIFTHVKTGEPPTKRPIEHRDLIAAAIRSLGEKT